MRNSVDPNSLECFDDALESVDDAVESADDAVESFDDALESVDHALESVLDTLDKKCGPFKYEILSPWIVEKVRNRGSHWNPCIS